jgi:hypothetical protein
MADIALKSYLINTLKNVTAGKRLITAILNEKEVGETFSDTIIKDLMKFHPNGKVKDPEYFVIRFSNTYKQRTLYFKPYDGDEDSVSYVACIENLFGKYKRDKKEELETVKAFRFATFDDVHRKFFKENTIDGIGICSNPTCKKECAYHLETKLHIDHCDRSFKSILEEFIAANKIILSTVPIYWDGMNPILSDSDLISKWQIFHNKRVKYRILCGSCNSSFGEKSTSYEKMLEF